MDTTNESSRSYAVAGKTTKVTRDYKVAGRSPSVAEWLESRFGIDPIGRVFRVELIVDAQEAVQVVIHCLPTMADLDVFPELEATGGES